MSPALPSLLPACGRPEVLAISHRPALPALPWPQPPFGPSDFLQRLSDPPESRPKAQGATPTAEQEALGLGSGSHRGLEGALLAPGFPSWSVNSAPFRLSVRQRSWSLPLGSFWGDER